MISDRCRSCVKDVVQKVGPWKVEEIDDWDVGFFGDQPNPGLYLVIV